MSHKALNAVVIHSRKPLDGQCNMGLRWTFPVAGLHALYVIALVAFTRAIRHVEFRFDELRDLWKGILVSATSIGIWVTAFVLNEIHYDISWLQVASRFVLLVTVSYTQIVPIICSQNNLKIFFLAYILYASSNRVAFSW